MLLDFIDYKRDLRISLPKEEKEMRSFVSELSRSRWEEGCLSLCDSVTICDQQSMYMSSILLRRNAQSPIRIFFDV